LKLLLDDSTANRKRKRDTSVTSTSASVKTLDEVKIPTKGRVYDASLAVARTVMDALDKKMTVRYIFVVPSALRFLKKNKNVFTRTDGVKVELTELHPSKQLIKRTKSPAFSGHNQLLPSQQLIAGTPPHSGRRNFSTFSPPACFALASSSRGLGCKAQYRHLLLPAASSTRVAQLLRMLSSL
jgi:hypothetical protein